MPPASLCLTLLFSTVSLGLCALSFGLLYPAGESHFLYLEMTLNTANLLSDFLSLIVRAWEEVEWERRGVSKDLGEFSGDPMWVVEALPVFMFLL